MELKPQISKIFIIKVTLLIVPYGIETSKELQGKLDLIALLIVPYGIET